MDTAWHVLWPLLCFQLKFSCLKAAELSGCFGETSTINCNSNVIEIQRAFFSSSYCNKGCTKTCCASNSCWFLITESIQREAYKEIYGKCQGKHYCIVIFSQGDGSSSGCSSTSCPKGGQTTTFSDHTTVNYRCIPAPQSTTGSLDTSQKTSSISAITQSSWRLTIFTSAFSSRPPTEHTTSDPWNTTRSNLSTLQKTSTSATSQSTHSGNQTTPSPSPVTSYRTSTSPTTSVTRSNINDSSLSGGALIGIICGCAVIGLLALIVLLICLLRRRKSSRKDYSNGKINMVLTNNEKPLGLSAGSGLADLNVYHEVEDSISGRARSSDNNTSLTPYSDNSRLTPTAPCESDIFNNNPPLTSSFVPFTTQGDITQGYSEVTNDQMNVANVYAVPNKTHRTNTSGADAMEVNRAPLDADEMEMVTVDNSIYGK